MSFGEAYTVIFRKLLGKIPDWWNEAGRLSCQGIKQGRDLSKILFPYLLATYDGSGTGRGKPGGCGSGLSGDFRRTLWFSPISWELLRARHLAGLWQFFAIGEV